MVLDRLATAALAIASGDDWPDLSDLMSDAALRPLVDLILQAAERSQADDAWSQFDSLKAAVEVETLSIRNRVKVYLPRSRQR